MPTNYSYIHRLVTQHKQASKPYDAYRRTHWRIQQVYFTHFVVIVSKLETLLTFRKLHMVQFGARLVPQITITSMYAKCMLQDTLWWRRKGGVWQTTLTFSSSCAHCLHLVLLPVVL